MTTQNQNSSVYMDLLREMHADVAEDLAINLDRESEKCSKILKTRGLPALIEWLELKLLPFLDCKPARGPEYRELFQKSPYYVGHDESAMSMDDVRVFAHVRQIYSLFRKLTSVECLEADEAAFAAWQARMKEHYGPLTTSQEVLAETLSSLITDLPDLDSRSYPAPDIGPGASFEKRNRRARPCYYYDKRFAFRGAEYEVPHGSRSVCVPKTFRRKRLIFVEPASRMLAQKAIQRWFHEQAATRYPYKRYMRLEDQSYQRALLMNEHAASIDLSDASDHIDRRIMWLFFKNHPNLRSALFYNRSVREEVSGTLITSFATMGNATTFPTMTFLLYAVIRLAELEAQDSGYTVKCQSGVFGDDIVVDRVIAGSVIGLLTRLGLKVNTSKSYVVGPFKESCGKDVFNGLDVTPTKVKDLTAVNSESWSRLIRYANSLLVAGYWRASDVLVSTILSRWPRTTFGPVGSEDCLWSFSLTLIKRDSFQGMTLSQVRKFSNSRTPFGVWNKYIQAVEPWVPRVRHMGTLSQDDVPNLDFWLANGQRAVDGDISV